MANPIVSKSLALRTKMLHTASGSIINTEKPIMFTGEGASLQMCRILPFHGHKKMMIITDAVLMELGIIDPIKAELESNGVRTVVYSDVQPDPTDAICRECLDIFLAQNCDSVLAIGGGSSIDTAKAVATMVTNPGLTIEELAEILKLALRNEPVPIYCIPTTSGTGSEVSPAAVISNSQTHEKSIVGPPGMMPKMAAIDTNIIKGQPKSITAFTGMDALTHAIEAFVSKSATAESNYFAKAAVAMILKTLPKAYDDGSDVQAREIMGIAAFYGGYAFSKALLGYVHSISHALSKFYHTPHGFTNAVVLPSVLRFNEDVIRDQLAELAVACGGQGGKAELSHWFIDQVVALNEKLGIPASYDKLEAQHIDEIVDITLDEAHMIYAVPKYMSKAECRAVVESLRP